MRNARTLYVWIVTALLVVGYGASQIAFFSGTTAEYYSRVDTPPIWALSWIVVLIGCVLWFSKVDDEA